MIQKTYYISENESTEDIIQKIENDKVIGDIWHTLFILHEYRSDVNEIKKDVTLFKEAFPGFDQVGTTMMRALYGDINMPSGLEVSVMSFEDSLVEVFRYDNDKNDIIDCTHNFLEKINKINNIKGILFFGSGEGINSDIFLKEMADKRSDIPVFGTLSGIQDFDNEFNAVFCEGEIYKSSIILVVFKGDNLNITVDTAFGWKAIGKLMTVTDCGDNGFVRKIDGINPADIYMQYLHIDIDKADPYDVSAFPFIFVTEYGEFAKIPVKCTHEGFYFPSSIKNGERVSLSYAKAEYLLDESLSLANRLGENGPQAVYGFVCGNRRMYLGDKLADQENAFFKKVNPDAMLGYGRGEIFVKNGHGGIYNSIYSVAAFREGGLIKAVKLVSDEEKRDFKAGRIGINTRLVSFLEKISNDLNDTVNHLSDLASFDQMTHVYNRSMIERTLQDISLRKDEFKSVFMFMFDIDNFKTINDVNGHDTGDSVIINIAEILKKKFRRVGMVGRWGGDEFLCISTNMTDKEAVAKGNEICKSVTEWDFSPAENVTVSCGIAESVGKVDIEELYKTADRAMYHSKHFGGNRVTMYSDSYKNELNVPDGFYHMEGSVRSLYENSDFPLMVMQIINNKFRVICLSDGYCKMVGTPRAQMTQYLNNGTLRRVHPDDIARVVSILKKYDDENDVSLIYRSLIRGEYHDVLALARKQLMENNTLVCIIHFIDFSDIDSRLLEIYKSYFEERDNKLYKDEVSDLPNINYFNSFAQGVMMDMHADGKMPYIIFFDIVGMHAYNERFGYEEGNSLIHDTGEIISSFFKDDFIVRYSEDHFVVITSKEVSGDLAEELNSKVSRRMKNLSGGIKTGLYACKDVKERAVSGVDKARQALNYIGNDRTRCFCVYSENVALYYQKREYILMHFNEAIENKRIIPYYQPEVRTLTGKVCGSEALARWVDPEKGVLEPRVFIEVLEDAHLIHILDLEIIEHVCQTLRGFIESGVMIQAISVNLSRVDFQICDIFEEIEKIRKKYDIPTELLNIEVTESTLTLAQEELNIAMKKFKKAGYALWMDDFGSDYSSLKTLRKYNFDLIKIDMSFLNDFENPKTKTIIASIVSMAKRLGMHTLCEGVSTAEQYEFLSNIGCEIAQGYFFMKPSTVDGIYNYMMTIGPDNFERYSERTFYEKTVEIDFLSDVASLVRNTADENNSYSGIAPIAFFERNKEGHIDVVFINNVYRSMIEERHITVERFKRYLSEKGNLFNNTINELIDKCSALGYTSSEIMSEGGKRLDIRVKRLSDDANRSLYALVIAITDK